MSNELTTFTYFLYYFVPIEIILIFFHLPITVHKTIQQTD